MTEPLQKLASLKQMQGDDADPPTRLILAPAPPGPVYILPDPDDAQKRAESSQDHNSAHLIAPSADARPPEPSACGQDASESQQKHPSALRERLELSARRLLSDLNELEPTCEIASHRELQEKTASLRDQNRSLEDQLRDSRDRIESLTDEASKLCDARDRAQRETLALKKGRDKLRKSKDTMLANYQVLQGELARLREAEALKDSQLRAEELRSASKREELRRALAQATARADEAAENNAKLDRRVERLKRRLAERSAADDENRPPLAKRSTQAKDVSEARMRQLKERAREAEEEKDFVLDVYSAAAQKHNLYPLRP